jgi:uncharacterized RDD family membrane protein YckC
MFCSKCGAQLTPGAAFCPSCGQPVPMAPSVVAVSSAGVPLPPTRVVGSGSPVIPAGVYPAGMQPGVIISPRPYAGFWLRLVAHIIDNVILGIIFGVIAGVCVLAVGVGTLQAMAARFNTNSDDPTIPLVIMGWIFAIIIVSLLLQWLYFATMESSEHQGTLGKMALGLIVTDLNDQRISFPRATGRFFAKIISGLIPLGIGYIMAGFTEKKQALHDMIASTLVLRKL